MSLLFLFGESMTDTDYKIFQLLWEDPKLGTVAARIIILALVVSIILERRTKLKPWTRLVQWIGKTANAPIIARVSEVDAKVDGLKKVLEDSRQESEQRDRQLKDDMELGKVLQARRRILRFSDEIINRIPHSREMFNDILEDCDTYESYYSKHPDLKNGRAKLAVENVKLCFRERVDKNDFLVGKSKNNEADEDTH